MPSALKHEQLV